MELAIINGTYRDNSNGKMAAANGMSRLSMPGLLQERIIIFRKWENLKIFSRCMI